MLVKFINCEVIVHQEYVPTGQMINQYYYLPEGPEVSRPSMESGLVDSPWQFAGTHCFVSAAVFCH